MFKFCFIFDLRRYTKAQKCTWSDYKQRNTWKVLASISPRLGCAVLRRKPRAVKYERGRHAAAEQPL
jgi:hypothetical protein